jgi:hypothetical protein
MAAVCSSRVAALLLLLLSIGVFTVDAESAGSSNSTQVCASMLCLLLQFPCISRFLNDHHHCENHYWAAVMCVYINFMQLWAPCGLCRHTRVMPCTRSLQSSAAALSEAAAHQVRTVSGSSSSSCCHKHSPRHRLWTAAEMCAGLAAALMAAIYVRIVAVSAVILASACLCDISRAAGQGQG